MVLSFLKKRKKFLKSTKNSTESRKVFNIYPHSVHIHKFCTETRVKAVFVHYPSVVSPGRENGRRRKKNSLFLAVISFSLHCCSILLQNFVYFGHTLAISPVVELAAESDRSQSKILHFQHYTFCIKIVLFLAIFAEFRKNTKIFIFFVL